MSDHSLPENLADWPQDPFSVLGVGRDASERELRRAYHALIRKYKPEHAPEAFRRIREALESAQQSAALFGSLISWNDEDLEAPSLHPTSEPDSRSEPLPERDTARSDEPSPPDAWDLACEGSTVEAYRALIARLEQGSVSEDVYLQLYWLCVVAPEVDRGRAPITWLVRGLARHGTRAFRLLELLRREIQAAPAAAFGERFAPLLSSGAAPGSVLEFATLRWRAARELEEWQTIVNDIKALKEWMPERNPEAWARLSLCASANLIWAPGTIRDAAFVFRRNAEALAVDHALDINHDLNRLEYAALVMSGLLQYISFTAPRPAGELLRRLFALSWDNAGPEAERRLADLLHMIAREPRAALDRLTILQSLAPAALGFLVELAGQSRLEPLQSHVVVEVEHFLSRTHWFRYPEFRGELLEFCFHRAIAPGRIAQAITKRWEYVAPDKRHLAESISADWPLHLVYVAYERAWC